MFQKFLKDFQNKIIIIMVQIFKNRRERERKMRRDFLFCKKNEIRKSKKGKGKIVSIIFQKENISKICGISFINKFIFRKKK